MVKKKKADIKEFNAIFQEEKEGGYSVWVPDLPGCVSQGETFEEARKNIAEAIALYCEDSSDDCFRGIDPRKQFLAPVRSYA